MTRYSTNSTIPKRSYLKIVGVETERFKWIVFTKKVSWPHRPKKNLGVPTYFTIGAHAMYNCFRKYSRRELERDWVENKFGLVFFNRPCFASNCSPPYIKGLSIFLPSFTMFSQLYSCTIINTYTYTAYIKQCLDFFLPYPHRYYIASAQWPMVNVTPQWPRCLGDKN